MHPHPPPFPESSSLTLSRRQNPASDDYDYNLIYNRLQHLLALEKSHDALTLSNILRSGLIRNIGGICSPSLYTHSRIGTKLLIEEYISTVSSAISYVVSLPTFTAQQKFSFIADTRQSFGRTSLVLQGGAIFGLCHLGVIKALHSRDLLPRIITGTGVGALISALVCVHSDSSLPSFLTSFPLNLSTFATRSPESASWSDHLLHRLSESSPLLDLQILEEYVHSVVQNLTFLEAYHLTNRILNITVAPPPNSPLPSSVLNYLTSPHVLIHTAASASCASSPTVELLCKNPDGEIVPYHMPDVESTEAPRWTWRPWWTASSTDPHTRITELFNVNNFIVSQARPYIAPFLYSSPQKVMKLVGMEVTHLLRQADTIGLVPAQVRRFLVDENIAGGDEGRTIVVAPKVGVKDWECFVGGLDKEVVEKWVGKGERAGWEVVERVRVAVEVEKVLESEYVKLKRRSGVEEAETAEEGKETAERMKRSQSVGL